jgi:tetratricopeptide (TPR) repeat protein
VPIDTKSIVEIFVKNDKVKILNDIEKYKKKLWNKFVKLDEPIFTQSNYQFDYKIYTDCYSVSIQLLRKDNIESEIVLQQLKEEKKYSEVLAFYKKEQKWIDLYGPETYSVLADTHKGLGLYSTANDLMAKYMNGSAKGRMIASLGRSSEYSLEKAKNFFELGDYSQALQHLPDEDSGRTLLIRALSEFRLGRKKQSYVFAEKALKDDD